MNHWIFYTVLAMVFYGVGEYFSKLYANGKTVALGLALVSYIVCTVLWFPALKNNNQLAIMTVTWDLLYIIIGVSLGMLVFNETLTRTQWIGMGMAVVSLFLLTSHR